MAYHQNFQSLLIAALIFIPSCTSKDTITPIQSVRDGETLVSAGENFVLGFFSPPNSKNRYIGIRFNKIPNQTVVWVANRENPVSDSSGILTINAGNLVLVGDGGYNTTSTTTTLWSSNISTVSNYSSARLMDSDKNSYGYSGGSQGKKKLLVTLLTVISVALLLCFCGYCWWKKAKGENFVLGFFSPGNSSTNRYVGIWYNKIPDQTIVWTANRENPVKNSSGVLKIKGGNLVLFDGGHSNNSNTLWSTNVSTTENYASAILTDSGNLVLTDDHQRVLWESFDYPTNTFLPRMKLGFNRRTGLNRILTSWKSTTDPAPGESSFGLDPRGMPQYILRKGPDPIWRSEPWNRPRLRDVEGRFPGFVFTYVANEDEMYYMYYSNDSSIIVRSLLDVSGVLRRLIWNNETRQWNLMWMAVADRVRAEKTRDWNMGEWSDGCMRSKPLDCGGKADGFIKLARVKLPDTSRSWVEPSWSLKACEVECLSNCSCTAYASADVGGDGRGCLIWYGNLSDLKVYSNEGQELYIRVAASELDKNSYGHSGGFQGKKKLLVTIITVIPVALLFLLCAYCWWKKAKGCKMNERRGVVFNNNEIKENSKATINNTTASSILPSIFWLNR
ncbi:hypothetical protein MRB53_021589 [Persea americana]|uniref:Uncharacterized protein n=1 Tax=Persea americana TaxID=3435 RepID=A0ACC2L4K3_PERAE|nr:hypothetical protein MRB53_021589 [Persea americana]